MSFRVQVALASENIGEKPLKVQAIIKVTTAKRSIIILVALAIWSNSAAKMEENASQASTTIID
jgi:hypothetical protein